LKGDPEMAKSSKTNTKKQSSLSKKINRPGMCQ
jgi:hypothetical protein